MVTGDEGEKHRQVQGAIQRLDLRNHYSKYLNFGVLRSN